MAECLEIGRGAEAVVIREGLLVRKRRLAKSYRVAALDLVIRQERTMMESRIMAEARRVGVPTPIIRDVDAFDLQMEFIDGIRLKLVVSAPLSDMVGELVGRLHRAGIVHGDLTTSNIMLRDGRLFFIDFGLAYHDPGLEAQGVDVHVYFQTLYSTHDQAAELVEAFKDGYRRSYENADEVLARVEEIKSRGRYL
ncbi:MAG TPA: Kae1-associated kinase Bud32 [Methanotrichaceae archaeon]|nr:Kae1-associated kinase Bud32 [Methanotrichaceae archaeon]HQF16263.1 Kae1-associated kinase Bud32 [Methanotrichaceae archaeon]HQI90035.1 Kae1-associated kinase Bud32 [Methanotrichaceae archaeon]HQJ27941.1 Kae1-associated kinase Bud32 [Methanotrichaceae archaeon]